MKYKVGDKVIIREWDDMEREFGVDFSGDIKARCCFVRPMREYCGKKMTIGGIICGDNYTMVNGDGWIFSADTFEKNNNQKIVITTDGVETLARLYEGDKVVKKATAKCSPDDTFDFNVGAKLAFERLMNEGKKPLTFREKLRQEHPEKLKKTYGGGCYGCPKNYGYEENGYCHKAAKKVETCTQCWDREIPEEKKEEYYNGKVVCVERGFGCSIPLPDITVGKVYTVTDGILVLDNNYKSCKYKTLDDICKGLGHKFIPFVE